jgi:uroporphyrinogen decarboxylase
VELTSRERILKAVHHQESDRVPIDLGGTDCSSIAIGPYRRLCESLGIDAAPYHIVDICQQIVVVNDRVADELGADAKVIWHLPNDWREGQAYDRTPVKYPAKFKPERLPNGDMVVLDKDGQACLRMPEGGFYYDVCHHPLKHVQDLTELNAYADVFESMDRPEWYDMPLKKLQKTVRNIRSTNDRALVGCFGGHVFQAGQFLRGWSEFLMDLAGNPALAEGIMDRLVQAHIEAFDRYAETAYLHIDIIEVCDDVGMQNTTWVSPQMYRRLIKPYHQRLYQHIKAKTGALLLLHSCGSVSSMIPDFIEIGVDILNPVQYTASHMDLATLKRDFGSDLCFWGGGVDTQKTLPFGTPEQVSDEVKRCIDTLAPGGGFVFAVVHNITEGVPTENIISAFQTAAEHGRY